MKINLANLKEKLLSDGYIIIENVVSHAHLDILFDHMIEKTWEMMKNKKWGGVGSLQGHLQQNPSRCSPYVFRDILSNPIVIAVSKSVLGPMLYNDFYSANTNCPGSIMQPVHSDCSPLWPGNTVLHPSFSLVINIPLIDVNEMNGSIELWPGSHMVLRAKKYVEEVMLIERTRFVSPIRANMKKGSVLIRDVRTWHRGMPNFSNIPRHMLAMIHKIHWLQRGAKIAFAKSCEFEILDNELEHNAYFTDEPIDHSIDPTYGAYAQIK